MKRIDFIFKLLDISSKHIGLELLPLESWDRQDLAACIPYFMLGPTQGNLYAEICLRQSVDKSRQEPSSSSASGNRRSPQLPPSSSSAGRNPPPRYLNLSSCLQVTVPAPTLSVQNKQFFSWLSENGGTNASLPVPISNKYEHRAGT